MKIKKIAQTPGVVATVVDNLSSDSSQDALSAKQGKALKAMIDNFTGGTTAIIDVDELPEITDSNRNQIIRYNNKLYHTKPVSTWRNVQVGDDLSGARVRADYPKLGETASDKLNGSPILSPTMAADTERYFILADNR